MISLYAQSLPTWECGLKLDQKLDLSYNPTVTPHVGVWIEIFDHLKITELHTVTPHVGVWIEIRSFARSIYHCLSKSLPTWECGLKCLCSVHHNMPVRSLPTWECGLKFAANATDLTKNLSLPSWECGLKLSLLPDWSSDCPSLPSWECGLKFVKGLHEIQCLLVTPLVGVWIEIFWLV